MKLFKVLKDKIIRTYVNLESLSSTVITRPRSGRGDPVNSFILLNCTGLPQPFQGFAKTKGSSRVATYRIKCEATA